MSSLQRHFGLPTDITLLICYSVLLMVHLLSFIPTMCPAHCHFILVTQLTMSVTLVLCLKIVLWILSFCLTSSILLFMAHWLVPSFFTNAFEKDQHTSNNTKKELHVCLFMMKFGIFRWFFALEQSELWNHWLFAGIWTMRELWFKPRLRILLSFFLLYLFHSLVGQVVRCPPRVGHPGL